MMPFLRNMSVVAGSMTITAMAIALFLFASILITITGLLPVVGLAALLIR